MEMTLLESSQNWNGVNMERVIPEDSNPLELTKILRRIFTHMSVNDLKNCRLVNKKWHETSFDLWRKRATINITYSCRVREIAFLLKTDDAGVVANLRAIHFQEFIQRFLDFDDFYQLSIKPFQRYSLLSWECWDENRDSDVIKLWTLIHPHVTYLDVDHCDVMDLNMFENILYHGDTMCKLETLRVAINSYYLLPNVSVYDRINEKCMTSLKHLTLKGNISCFPEVLDFLPNLESLTVEFNQIPMHFGFICRLIREDGEVNCKIKHLDVMKILPIAIEYPKETGYIEISHVNCFALESFAVDLGYQSKEEDIYPILKKHRATLKTLSLLRAPFSPPFMTPFPWYIKLNSLTELHLYGHIVNSLQFLRMMPQLKILKMDKLGIRWKSKYDQLLRSSPLYSWNPDIVQETWRRGELSELVTMHHLEQLDIDYNLTKDSLRLLKIWMPNLKRIGCVLTNEKLQVICEQWRELEELVVMYGSDIDDYGLIGRSCGGQRVTNVFDLKRLRVFRLDAFCAKAKLSNAGVERFLNMTSLKSLHVCVSKYVNENMEAKLKKAIQSVCIIRNYKDGHLEECCRLRVFLAKCGIHVSH